MELVSNKWMRSRAGSVFPGGGKPPPKAEAGSKGPGGLALGAPEKACGTVPALSSRVGRVSVKHEYT